MQEDRAEERVLVVGAASNKRTSKALEEIPESRTFPRSMPEHEVPVVFTQHVCRRNMALWISSVRSGGLRKRDSRRPRGLIIDCNAVSLTLCGLEFLQSHGLSYLGFEF